MTITLTREEAQQVLDALDKYGFAPLNHDKDWQDFKRTIELLRARLSAPEPEREKGDMPCIEDDGCPTEKAVLQRFWRKHRQPEPEPVAWMTYESEHRLRSGGNHRGAVPVHQKSSREAKIPLYAAPPQREWKGLTDEEIKAMRHMRDWTAGWTDIKYAREIEAKLKLKNGYAEEKNT